MLESLCYHWKLISGLSLHTAAGESVCSPSLHDLKFLGNTWHTQTRRIENPARNNDFHCPCLPAFSANDHQPQSGIQVRNCLLAELQCRKQLKSFSIRNRTFFSSIKMDAIVCLMKLSLQYVGKACIGMFCDKSEWLWTILNCISPQSRARLLPSSLLTELSDYTFPCNLISSVCDNSLSSCARFHHLLFLFLSYYFGWWPSNFPLFNCLSWNMVVT